MLDYGLQTIYIIAGIWYIYMYACVCIAGYRAIQFSHKTNNVVKVLKGESVCLGFRTGADLLILVYFFLLKLGNGFILQQELRKGPKMIIGACIINSGGSGCYLIYSTPGQSTPALGAYYCSAKVPFNPKNPFKNIHQKPEILSFVWRSKNYYTQSIVIHLRRNMLRLFSYYTKFTCVNIV